MNQTLILVIIALQQDFFFPVCMWGLCVCVCGEGWGNSITLRPEKYQMSGELLSMVDLKLGYIFISFIELERYACLNGRCD